MSLLPANWVRAPIGSLCDLQNGRAFKPAEWSQDGLPIVRIQNLNNASAPFNRFDGAYDNKHYLKGGELLFAWSGTPGTSFGAHVWRGGEALLNQHIFRVDFDGALLDRRFFRHAINQKLTELIDVAHGGAGLQHVTKGVFESTEVSLPPREEQKRIADKLDTVLTRVDAVNTRLARVAPILKRFRQSVLAAATSGRLTEDWSGNRKATYPKLPMAEIADMRLGKMLDKAKNTGVPVPYLRNVNVRWFQFDLSDVLELRIEEHERDGLSIANGDLLVCEGGEPGRCAVWQGGPTDLIFQKALHRVRPDASVALSKWIAYVLKHLCDSGEITSFFTGSTIKHLTGTALAKVPIPVPSLDEQTEIVRRVETLFTFADRLEARLQTAQAATERLTPALLAKAFRGELVPQDPNDEPASELLKRLAAQAPTGPAKGRRAKASASAAC